MNNYIINMFILPPGLSDDDVKLFMKLYKSGSQNNRINNQDITLQKNVESKEIVDSKRIVDSKVIVESKQNVEKGELKQQIIKHLAKNPSTSLSSLMAYSMIFRD